MYSISIFLFFIFTGMVWRVEEINPKYQGQQHMPYDIIEKTVGVCDNWLDVVCVYKIDLIFLNLTICFVFYKKIEYSDIIYISPILLSMINQFVRFL
jgi:hypothetical protein